MSAEFNDLPDGSLASSRSTCLRLDDESCQHAEKRAPGGAKTGWADEKALPRLTNKILMVMTDITCQTAAMFMLWSPLGHGQVFRILLGVHGATGAMPTRCRSLYTSSADLEVTRRTAQLGLQ